MKRTLRLWCPERGKIRTFEPARTGRFISASAPGHFNLARPRAAIREAISRTKPPVDPSQVSPEMAVVGFSYRWERLICPQKGGSRWLFSNVQTIIWLASALSTTTTRYFSSWSTGSITRSRELGARMPSARSWTASSPAWTPISPARNSIWTSMGTRSWSNTQK